MSKSKFIGQKVGMFVIKVYNAHEIYGHDDTWPFNADFEVTVNGEPYLSGTAWNDGWGGPCQIGYEHTTENVAKEQELDGACAMFNHLDKRYNFMARYDFADIVEIMAMLYNDGGATCMTYSENAMKNFLETM